MNEVELCCAVHGKGAVFPVKIARDAKVSALQKAIFDDQRYHERFSFPPSELTLYLAKKNGAWLKHDYSVEEELLQGKIDTGYKKMLSSWKLDDDEYFKKKFQPGDKEIHVLVELPPEAAAGSASEKSAATKRKYSHSNVGESSSKGVALLQDLNIRVKPARSFPLPTEDSILVPPFTWDSFGDESGHVIVLTEEQQRERYRKYVEDNIGDVLARKQLCVHGVEHGRNILSVAVPGYDVDLFGRTDMLVLSDLVKKSPLYLDLLPEVKLLIEVKRTVKGGSFFQAVSELIALDVLVDDPVMALLTDLTGHWEFFWVSERSDNHVIIRTVTISDPSAAFAVIRTLLAQSPSADAEIRLPCFEQPVKRRKLAQLLPSVSEGDGSSGIREAIERYYDIASVLGPDIDMARATAHQIARTIPVLSYYT